LYKFKLNIIIMKRAICLIVMLSGIYLGSIRAQDKISGREFTMEEEDTVYVMKKYFLCILIAGPNLSQTSAEALDLQVAHLAHISMLSKSGQLVLAGPLESGTNGRLKGIFVFDTETIAAAEALVCQDPMVRVSRLDFEMTPWWAVKGSCLP